MNAIKKIFLSLLVFTSSFFDARAQEDLMKMLESQQPADQKEFITNSFKSSRVIMCHSLENVAEGVLEFRILHRFGRLSSGAYEAWGLDQATIRLGLDYGITKRLTAGIGRSSYKKEADGFAKYKIIWQAEGKGGMPFSLIYIAGMTVNGLKYADPERKNFFTSRLAYYHQLVIGRKFSERFTLQVAPTFVHQNIVPEKINRHDIIAAEIGGRIKLTKRLALNADYFYVVDGAAGDIVYKHPLSIGFDIETGGHVFQLHFSNATGMNERAFITETDGDWGKGEVQFGFNISRVFTIADKRNKK